MRKKRKRLSDETLQEAVSEAAMQLGWTIPTDEDGVAKAEEWMALDAPDLPNGLRTPPALTSPGPTAASPCIIELTDASAFISPMARAAREGGELSPEVDEIMRRDREAAEKEFDSRNEQD